MGRIDWDVRVLSRGGAKGRYLRGICLPSTGRSRRRRVRLAPPRERERIRRGDRSPSPYVTPTSRRRERLAFLDMVIADAARFAPDCHAGSTD